MPAWTILAPPEVRDRSRRLDAELAPLIGVPVPFLSAYFREVEAHYL
jgi:hypothetical protein